MKRDLITAGPFIPDMLTILAMTGWISPETGTTAVGATLATALTVGADMAAVSAGCITASIIAVGAIMLEVLLQREAVDSGAMALVGIVSVVAADMDLPAAEDMAGGIVEAKLASVAQREVEDVANTATYLKWQRRIGKPFAVAINPIHAFRTYNQSAVNRCVSSDSRTQ